MRNQRMDEGCLLAIPVFNEERYVHRVIEEAKRYCRHILVIDDGSTDRTSEALRLHNTIHVITHTDNQGYGKSLGDAFEFAQRNAYKWLITMDCDEQHEPSYIPRFLAAMAQDDADIISGTRYPIGQEVDVSVPADRREINRQITAMLNQRLDLDITDAFCGFKAYRVAELCRINITVPGYAMPMQLWVQVARLGLRVQELPVRLIYNDPRRHFGGTLDDPMVRLEHYLAVFEAEMAREEVHAGKAKVACLPCH